MGLSKCHISPHAWVEWAPEGSFIAVARVGYGAPPSKDRPTRGRVQGFSARSRSRMLKQLAKLNRDAIRGALMVTLTYPGVYAADERRWKRDLDVWTKRLVRRCPQASYVWKLEFQARGAPHYHLLLFGVHFLAKDWLSESWYEVVGSHDARHRVAGTQVARLRSANEALAYAAKYISKRDSIEDDGYWGRYWGVYGRERLPIIVYFKRVSLGDGYSIRRIFIALAKRHKEKRKRPRKDLSWRIISGGVAARIAASVLALP